MKKYGIIIVFLFVAAIGMRQYIDPAPADSSYHSYLGLPSWSDQMFEYCTQSERPCSFLPLQKMWANRLRLQAIQYIGVDVYASYHDQLYDRLSDIASLSPEREYPFVFGQYVLPDYQDTANEQAAQQAMSIGNKGLQSLCDTAAMDTVLALSEEEFLTMYYGADRVVPCPNYILPQALGFVVFYYLQDIDRAMGYYRVAALAYDAPDTLVHMPAIITARYDDDRKSMMMWDQRIQAAQGQLNPELGDHDLFFLLSTIEHAIRKAVHHMFVSLIQQTADQYNCNQDSSCIQQNIASVAVGYLSACESDDLVTSTICNLLQYATAQGRRDGASTMIYPLDPDAFVYGWRPDLEKWDIVPL